MSGAGLQSGGGDREASPGGRRVGKAAPKAAGCGRQGCGPSWLRLMPSPRPRPRVCFPLSQEQGHRPAAGPCFPNCTPRGNLATSVPPPPNPTLPKKLATPLHAWHRPTTLAALAVGPSRPHRPPDMALTAPPTVPGGEELWLLVVKGPLQRSRKLPGKAPSVLGAGHVLGSPGQEPQSLPHLHCPPLPAGSPFTLSSKASMCLHVALWGSLMGGEGTQQSGKGRPASGGVQAFPSDLDPVLSGGLLCVRLWGLRRVTAKVRVQLAVGSRSSSGRPWSLQPRIHMPLCAPRLCLL